MAKKCLPGGYCFENMTLFVGMILVLLGGYLFLRVSDLGNKIDRVSMDRVSLDRVSVDRPNPGRCGRDMFTDPYAPPMRCDSGMPNGIPINIPTQGYDPPYSQIGILRAQLSPDILPLMGRRLVASRQKWQYYTVSGGGPGGNLQTKLPIKVQGRNCSNEYGCDEIFNKDEVFVEGFEAKFTATIYENGLFSYLP